MIDYDTLKKAHELCDKTDYYIDYSVAGDTMSPIEIWVSRDNYLKAICQTDMENLLNEVKWLVFNPTAKHKAGDKVWILGNFNSLTEATIGVHANDDVWLVFDNEPRRLLLDTDDLYESREALIQAQLWFWTERMAEDMRELPGASCCSVHAGGHEECI